MTLPDLDPIAYPVATPERTPVVLSYGLGVDSTAILLRWLTDPSSRDFELEDLIVITAMTGNEFKGTGHLVERWMLPLMRLNGVRFIQVARAGRLEADGVVMLDDCFNPARLHLEGVYKLSDELMAAGTVPQYASGCRRCSLKFKGWVLDYAIEAVLGKEQPFRHVIGFNAGEQKRIERDKSYSTKQRQSEYPLLEWGWDRELCEAYITSILGIEWQKSCCTFCPFAGGKKAHLKRLEADREAALEAMMLEFCSLALNPRMTLYAGQKALIDCVEPETHAAFDDLLAETRYNLYRVRRVYKGTAYRCVEVFDNPGVPASRSFTECYGLLQDMAEIQGKQIESDGWHDRVYIHRRDMDADVAIEEFYVVAPAHIADKSRTTFTKHWNAALEAHHARTGEEVRFDRDHQRSLF